MFNYGPRSRGALSILVGSGGLQLHFAEVYQLHALAVSMPPLTRRKKYLTSSSEHKPELASLWARMPDKSECLNTVQCGTFTGTILIFGFFLCWHWYWYLKKWYGMRDFDFCGLWKI